MVFHGASQDCKHSYSVVNIIKVGLNNTGINIQALKSYQNQITGQRETILMLQIVGSILFLLPLFC